MKKIITVFTVFLLCMTLVIPVSAHPSRLIDEAGLLTEEETYDVNSMLNQFSDELGFDIVVVTVNSLEGKSAGAYADDYFDYNGYGMGEDRDGALLLVAVEESQWYISTSGYGLLALSDADLDSIGEQMVPYMGDGEFGVAFETFAWRCYNEVKTAVETGVTAQVVEDEGFGWTTGILVSLVIGFVGAFIPMLMMKRKMKTVVARSEAAEYVKGGSRRITRSHDRFLYHTINRVYTPKQETSSSHTSSSGRSHGGRGGSF